MTNVVRAESVAQEVLIPAILKASVAGTSAKDVAISLGMNPESFNSRVSQLRTALSKAKNPFDLPYLSGSGSRSKIDINNAAENAAKLMKQLVADAKAEAEAEEKTAEAESND